uniref:beta-1 adrenergic receptor-like n=1 Tax=Myxine glutinosa TaxID=7769 RepID=UPI00358F71CF
MSSNNISALIEPWYTIFGVLFTLAVLFTISGNVLVLVAVLRSQRLMQSVTSYFICSLAFADLLIGLVVMPLTSVQIIEGTWLFGRQMCDFRYTIDAASVTASINSLSAIAIDRYVAVTMPLRYSSIVTRRRAQALTIIVWIIAMTVSSVFIIVGRHQSGEVHIACYENPQCCSVLATKVFATLSAVFAFYLPLTIMFILYARILREANAQKQKIGQNNSTGSISNSDRRALKTLALILGVFVICWFPFFTIYLVQSFCRKCITDGQFYLIIWLGYINSLCNPVLYSFFYSHFKHKRRTLVFTKS